MAVRTLKEITDTLKAKFGDDTSDDVIGILEDITDTITDYDTRAKDSGDWKTKYEENDKAWRKKYVDRFSGLTEEEEEKTKVDVKTEEAEEDGGPTKYEDLFTVVKEDQTGGK